MFNYMTSLLSLLSSKRGGSRRRLRSRKNRRSRVRARARRSRRYRGGTGTRQEDSMAGMEEAPPM